MAKTFQAYPYQLQDVTSWQGLTRETHLINAYGDQPQYLDNIVRNIFTVNYGLTFDEWLNQFPIKYVDEDKMFRWKLRGRDEKNIPLLAAWEDENGTVAIGTTNPNVGINGMQFFLDYPEDYFSKTMVIVGEKPDLYHLFVIGDPIQVSTNRYRYKVQLVTGDDDFFIPTYELTAGTRWSADYGLTERYLSKEGSGISYSSPFSMQNRISMMRMQETIAGEMINKGKNQPYVFGFVGEDGKTRMAWINHMEYEFIRRFKERMNKLVFYGKTTLREDGTSTLKGSSGNAIEAGLGIREQIASSSQFYYDTLSFERLKNTLLDISVGRKTMDQRNFVIGTGEYGLSYLHDMLVSHLGANDYEWVKDTTGRAFTWNGNDLNVKLGQFRGFATINGINVSFMHIDHYDDPIRNKLLHPNGGVAESYRMTIIDAGSKSDPNIHKIRIKGEQPYYGIINGIRNPYNMDGNGYSKPQEISSPVDGYEIHIMDKTGAVIIDPTRVVEFIPSILR